MKTLVFTGWRPYLDKMGLAYALMDHGELAEASAVVFVESLVDGTGFRISIPDEEVLHALAADAYELGAICHIEEDTVVPRDKRPRMATI